MGSKSAPKHQSYPSCRSFQFFNRLVSSDAGELCEGRELLPLSNKSNTTVSDPLLIKERFLEKGVRYPIYLKSCNPAGPDAGLPTSRVPGRVRWHQPFPQEDSL